MTVKPETKLQTDVDEEGKPHHLVDEEEYDYVAVPPDGGFGWVVLIACFVINLIVDGFLYAFGAVSTDIKNHFGCSEGAVALVISLACGFYLLSAPVASALCNKWGCRKIGIIGSIIAGLAIMASVYAPNIYVMWLLFGFIGGIGLGLVYLPSIVMVGYYFEGKRAIATGIVTAGTGIGSVVFGPLARFLFTKLGWEKGLLILSGILLCCVICCIFMRPLKPIRKRRVALFNDSADDNVFGGTVSSPFIKETTVTQAAIISPSADTSTIYLTEPPTGEKLRNRSRIDSTLSTKSKQSIKAEDAVRPLYKEDVLYQGDTRDLPEYRSQPDLATYVQQTTKVPETVEKSKMKAFWDIFLSMANFELLADKKMLVICLANVCSMIGYYTPYLFIVQVAALEKGVQTEAAVYLLSIIGFSNTATRFLSGWVTKIPYMTPLLVNNIGLTVAGIATLLVPLCHTYTHLALYCIVWGAFIAFHVSLSPVIVCELVGLERYSNALGLTLMFRGITALAAPPLMGAIRDRTSSFNISFIIGGISFITSALMHFFLMWMDRQEKAQLDKTQKNGVTQTTTEISAV